MPIVREAVTFDMLLCLSLAEVHFKEAAYSEWGFDGEGLAQALIYATNSEEHCTLVAVKDNKVVGYLWGYLTKEPWSLSYHGLLNFLFIHPDNRDLFTAKKLVNSFIEWVEGHDLPIAGIQTGVHSGIGGNRPALSLFKRCGFKEAGINLMRP